MRIAALHGVFECFGIKMMIAKPITCAYVENPIPTWTLVCRPTA